MQWKSHEKKNLCKWEVEIMENNMLNLDNGLLKVEEIVKSIIIRI